MSQPEIVQTDLAGEEVVTRIGLGGEDELYVTPTRTLLYRAEGLLADESVEEFPHGAERITVSGGRRKSKLTLDYGLDGERTLTVSSNQVDDALRPILQGVLRHNGVLEGDETIERLFRFSELTIVVADQRVVRHIGPAVWDRESESYHYSDVTDLAFEDGSVNTSVVLSVGGQRERFKTPNEDARAVRSALESTLLSYQGVDSVAELRAATAPDEDDGAGAGNDADEVSFGNGPDPLFADPAEPDELPDNATRTAGDGEPGGGVGGSGAAGFGESPQQAEHGTPSGDSATSEETTHADASASTERIDRVASVSDASASSDAPDDVGGVDRASSGSRGGADRPESGGGFEGSGFEAATPATDEQILEEVTELQAAVERQSEQLSAQRELIEQLIEELRRGR